MSGNILSESFEGAGYENGENGVGSWSETVGSGSVVDEDNTDIARPAGGGDQVLKIQKVSPNFNARTDYDKGSDQAITYTTFYVRIAAEGLTDSEFVYLFQGINNAWQQPISLYLEQSSGSLYFKFRLYNDGDPNVFYYSDNTVSLDTWYRIDIKYDYTGETWEWRVNTVVQDSGTLIGTFRAGPRRWYLGCASYAKTLTAYFDLCNVDDSGYVSFGEEFKKILNEQLQINEDEHAPSALKRIINEVVQFVETKLRAINFRRIINETVSLIENIVKKLTGQELLKIIDETVQVGESVLRIFGLKRIIDEMVKIYEIRKIPQVINESISLVENIVKKLVLGGQGLIKVIDETLQLVEAKLRTISFRRIIDETTQVVESKIRMRILTRIINETQRLIEGKISIRTLARIIGETLNLTESRSRVFNFRRIVDEAIQLVESKLNLRVMKRIVDETVNLVEGIVKYFSGQLVRVINEAVNLVESKLTAFSFRRIINEAVQTIESKVRLTGLRRWIGEALNIVESKVRSFGFRRFINETLNIQENVGKARNIIRIIAETLSLITHPIHVLQGLVEPVKTVLLKGKLTEQIQKIEAKIKKIISLNSKITPPEGE